MVKTEPDDHRRHDDRIITAQKRVKEQEPDTRPGEDALDDDGATNQPDKCRSQENQERQNGIPQTVLEPDVTAMQSFGLRRAYEIAVNGLQHGRAHKPR